MTHARPIYLTLAFGTIAIGLLVHLGGSALGPALRDILGDALWAAMIVWLAGALAPGARPWMRWVSAYVVCVLVELSQLIRTPALDAVRASLVGHLVLGSGFDTRDLLVYALGVAGAAALDAALPARGTKQFDPYQR